MRLDHQEQEEGWKKDQPFYRTNQPRPPEKLDELPDYLVSQTAQLAGVDESSFIALSGTPEEILDRALKPVGSTEPKKKIREFCVVDLRGRQNPVQGNLDETPLILVHIKVEEEQPFNIWTKSFKTPDKLGEKLQEEITRQFGSYRLPTQKVVRTQRPFYGRIASIVGLVCIIAGFYIAYITHPGSNVVVPIETNNQLIELPRNDLENRISLAEQEVKQPVVNFQAHDSIKYNDIISLKDDLNSLDGGKQLRAVKLYGRLIKVSYRTGGEVLDSAISPGNYADLIMQGDKILERVSHDALSKEVRAEAKKQVDEIRNIKSTENWE